MDGHEASTRLRLTPPVPSTPHLPPTMSNALRSSMSSTRHTPSTSSNFEALFEAALAKFTKCTGQDLRNHPIATKIDRCRSPDTILAIFEEQSRAFDEFRNGDHRLTGRLKPIVDGLHAISTNATLSAGASLVSSPFHVSVVIIDKLHRLPQAFPPANIVFSGFGFLLSVRVTLSNSN